MWTYDSWTLPTTIKPYTIFNSAGYFTIGFGMGMLFCYGWSHHYVECVHFCLRARLMDCCHAICWCRRHCFSVPTSRREAKPKRGRELAGRLSFCYATLHWHDEWLSICCKPVQIGCGHLHRNCDVYVYIVGFRLIACEIHFLLIVFKSKQQLLSISRHSHQGVALRSLICWVLQKFTLLWKVIDFIPPCLILYVETKEVIFSGFPSQMKFVMICLASAGHNVWHI